jgi:hypothetical protein
MATKKQPTKKAPKPSKTDEPLRLSLACGGNKPEGFKGVDIVRT